MDVSPATDADYECTVTIEVNKSGTLATGAADINSSLEGADHATFGNDDVTCVA